MNRAAESAFGYMGEKECLQPAGRRTLWSLSLRHLLRTLCKLVLAFSHFLLVLCGKCAPSAQEVDHIQVKCLQEIDWQEHQVFDQLDKSPALRSIKTRDSCLLHVHGSFCHVSLRHLRGRLNARDAARVSSRWQALKGKRLHSYLSSSSSSSA